MTARLKRAFAGMALVTLLICCVPGYILLARVAALNLRFGRYNPNYYILAGPTVRGFPQPQMTGSAGYFYQGGWPLWRGVRFESRATREEMHAQAKEYLLSSGFTPSPEERHQLPKDYPMLPELPASFTEAVYERGNRFVFVVVREKEAGGIEVSADESYFDNKGP